MLCIRRILMKIIAKLLWKADWPSKHVGVLDDGELRRSSFADFKDASPFGEVGAVLFVGLATSQQIVEALSGALVIGASQRYNAFVHFNANLKLFRDGILLMTNDNLPYVFHVFAGSRARPGTFFFFNPLPVQWLIRLSLRRLAGFGHRGGKSSFFFLLS